METDPMALDDTMWGLHRFIGVVGGMFGLGAAIAAFVTWIYRRGYERGREVERSRQQSQVIERLSKHLEKRKG